MHLFPDAISAARSSSRRLAALGLICLLGGAALASEVHLFAVRHVQCVTHGDWMHAGEPGPAASPQAGGDVVRGAPSEGVHQHEHGDLALLGHAGAVLVPGLELAAPPAAPAAPAVAAGRLPCSTRLYALAPKSSPPRT